MKILNKLVSIERTMLRMVWGAALRERISSSEIADRVDVNS